MLCCKRSNVSKKCLFFVLLLSSPFILFLDMAALENYNTRIARSIRVFVSPTAIRPLPLCPEFPALPLSDNETVVKVNKSTVDDTELLRKYSFMKEGSFAPQDCQQIDKTAIIIPYRNRSRDLNILVKTVMPVLLKQKLDFTIFVIEQLEPKKFNRASLLNVGFLEAMKMADYSCFIFHDVDRFPTNYKCLYRCGSQPIRLISGGPVWGFEVPYPEFFGAVVALSRDQYLQINGASNSYFGYGAEDDDLYERLEAIGYGKIKTYPPIVGYFDSFIHDRDPGNEANSKRHDILKGAVKRMNKDGLNSIMYNIVSIVKFPLYIWIKTDIKNQYPTFTTLPPRNATNTKISSNITVKH